MPPIYPIIPAAAAAKAAFPLDHHCALSPCCQGRKMIINDVRIPFCHHCFNWLPDDFQESMRNESAEFKGWQFSNKIPPTFTNFSWLVKKIVGISFASTGLKVAVGGRSRKIGGRPSWDSVGYAPRCDFKDRYEFLYHSPSVTIKLIEKDKGHPVDHDDLFSNSSEY